MNASCSTYASLSQFFINKNFLLIQIYIYVFVYKIILKMFESYMSLIDSRFAFMVNKKFRPIITVQFVVSMLVVCFNLYQLTQMTINAKSIQIMLYMCCMLTQISIYCWYGNEVKLKVCTF